MKCLLSLLMVAFALPAGATTAVIPVVTDGGDAAVQKAFAHAVRTSLSAEGEAVLSAEETAKRLMLTADSGRDISDVSQKLADAEKAYADVELDKSIALLESAIATLAKDPTFSVEKQKMLEESRVKAAARLMGKAGPDESGRGETEAGKRALLHLVDAARTNATLSLDPARYPPKVRRLLEKAQRELRSGGLGGLNVDSTPPGATVFLEGRAFGLTPLRLVEALPPGRYRMWVAQGDVRSATRWVDVGSAAPSVEVDLAFEGALWTAGPGLRPLAGTVVDDAYAQKLAALLNVDRVVFAGVEGENAWALSTTKGASAAFTAAGKESAAAAALARALKSNAAQSADAQALPEVLRALVAPPPAAAGGPEATVAQADVTESDDGFPMWTLGAAGGAALGLLVVGAVGAGVGGGLLWFLSTQNQDPVGQLDVEVTR